MAVNNLAEQCYLAAYGPLDKMNVLTMMDMVKVISQANIVLSTFHQPLFWFSGVHSGQERDREESEETDGVTGRSGK